MKNIIQSQKGFLQIPIMISVGLLIVVGAYFGIVKYGSNNTEQLKSTASQIGKDVAESEVKSLKQEVAALKKQVENKPNPFDFLSAPTVQTNTNAINRQSEALKEIDRKLFELYEEELADIPGIRFIGEKGDRKSSCWLATVIAERRDDLKRKLKENNIESDPVHYRCDRYTVFGGRVDNCPNMDSLEDKYIVLPMHYYVTLNDIKRICKIIRSGW